MNRDEAWQRQEQGMQKILGEHCVVKYPKDGQAGGTWVGANDFGIAMALLNRYQDPQHIDKRSRGLIIPEALINANMNAVKQHLLALDFSVYNPFDLVIASVDYCWQIQWTGADMTYFDIKPTPWFFITSTSVDLEQVTEYRLQHFNRWLALNKSVDHVLEDVHLWQSCNQSYSICMQRSVSHTKSISQIELGKGSTTRFVYSPIEEYIQASA